MLFSAQSINKKDTKITQNKKEKKKAYAIPYLERCFIRCSVIFSPSLFLSISNKLEK